MISLLTMLIISIPLSIILWNRWCSYARTRHRASLKHVLLELFIPKEMAQSSKSMELFLHALHLPTKNCNFLTRLSHGRSIPEWSFEVAAVDGVIHFYIRVEQRFQHLITHRLYTCYPSIEFTAAEDYTKRVAFDESNHCFLGLDYRLARPSPIPIKTYRDLDTAPDPILHLFDVIASSSKGGQVWLQFLARPYAKTKYVCRKGLKKIDPFAEEARNLIERLSTKRKNKEQPHKPLDIPTESNRSLANRIEQTLNKPRFECSIRALYSAPHAHFNKAIAASLAHLFTPYNGESYNSIVMSRSYRKGRNIFERGIDTLKGKKAHTFITQFVTREYFDRTPKRKHMVFNTEALATLVHFPEGAGTLRYPEHRAITIKNAPPSTLPM